MAQSNDVVDPVRFPLTIRCIRRENLLTCLINCELLINGELTVLGVRPRLGRPPG